MKKDRENRSIQEVTWPVGPRVDPLVSNTDPQGWYTGRPNDRWELPVQDADDL